MGSSILDQRLGRSTTTRSNRAGFGYKRAKDAVNAQGPHFAHRLPARLRRITGLMRDVTLALNPGTGSRSKDPIIVPVYVDLPARARKKYRGWARHAHASTARHQAFAASGKVLKMLQLSNGAVFTGSDEQIQARRVALGRGPRRELDALESIIPKNDGEPILVAYHFKPDWRGSRSASARPPHQRKADEDCVQARR